MKVDIELLKKLREITFAPLKDCKEALIDAEWDLDKAQDVLKQKWILKAWQRAERDTNEGIAKAVEKDWRIFALKLLCETDFVAKNDDFQALFDRILGKLFWLKKEINSKDSLDNVLLDEINNEISEFVGKVWENMKLGDVIITNKHAYLYNHPWNKVVSIIYYEWDNQTIAKELALQVAAMNPIYVKFDLVPQNYRDELLAKFREELKDSGKPANVVDQIIDGKLKKSLADLVLLEQEYIRDGSKKIKEIIPADFKIIGFDRLAI